MLKDGWFLFLFVVLAGIALGHFWGIYALGYWSLWWFDIVTHFLGGLWVGGMALWLLTKGSKRSNTYVYWAGMVAAFLVGVGWEVFEVVTDPLLSSEAGYLSDTICDLFTDTAGGLLAALLFLRSREKMNKL